MPWRKACPGACALCTGWQLLQQYYGGDQGLEHIHFCPVNSDRCSIDTAGTLSAGERLSSPSHVLAANQSMDSG
jgi:hypothetical protein